MDERRRRRALAHGRAGARAPTRPFRCPARSRDAYGAGDSFAAGTTFALGRGDSIEEALALGARCGAEAITREAPTSDARRPTGRSTV